jgi:hypothetical protein
MAKSISARRVEKRDNERRNQLVLDLLACKDVAARLGLWETMHAIDGATKAIGWEIARQLQKNLSP